MNRLALQRTDWLAFGIATVSTMGVYLFTLAPEVTLEWSGMLSTGVMYAGVQPPPGNPVWTLYAWVFTKLMPFSNPAWRVAVSSAVAGALACGVVALTVSQGGRMVLAGVRGLRALPAKEESALRAVCGAVAGMALGFHRVFWGQAVIVESTTLGILLFSLVLWLLLQWVQDADRNRCLYAAFLVYGLGLTVNMSLAAAAPGLLGVILLRNPSLGRDLLFAAALGLFATLLLRVLRLLPEVVVRATQVEGLYEEYFVVGAVLGLVCAVMIVLTGRLLTHWRTAGVAALLLLAAFSVLLYLPIASMTNPPNNWGYPRTVEGFYHLIGRGQYELVRPTDSLSHYLRQMWQYARQTGHDLGVIYLLPALLPFGFLPKMRGPEQGWVLGLLSTFLCLSFFMVAMLNSGPEKASTELVALYFIPSHLILAVWAGYGLALLATSLGRNHSLPNVS